MGNTERPLPRTERVVKLSSDPDRYAQHHWEEMSKKIKTSWSKQEEYQIVTLQAEKLKAIKLHNIARDTFAMLMNNGEHKKALQLYEENKKTLAGVNNCNEESDKYLEEKRPFDHLPSFEEWESRGGKVAEEDWVEEQKKKKWDEKLKKIRKINGYQAQYIKEKERRVKDITVHKEVGAKVYSKITSRAEIHKIFKDRNLPLPSPADEKDEEASPIECWVALQKDDAERHAKLVEKENAAASAAEALLAELDAEEDAKNNKKKKTKKKKTKKKAGPSEEVPAPAPKPGLAAQVDEMYVEAGLEKREGAKLGRETYVKHVGRAAPLF
ncbi:hypothetical protein TeGR_g3565 [Tetraparma gracilis]|uniref:Uncharacterized protein n=1 Tax=Tetraparma gracilis TaxID=2962635 RepID=A0ABQ6NBC9_9STRA|nr:hypothetical protein TeGR_g3565 [Tetraparma gracilis]